MPASERAWEFDRDLHERAAARVQRFEQGAALFNATLPRVYDANFVRLDSALGDLTAADAERIVHTLQRGLGHRKLLLPDRGERLAADLGSRGWTVNALAVMAWAGGPHPSASGAEQVERRALRAAREAAVADRAPDVKRQIVDYTERVARANDGRAFAAFADGDIASFCVLYESDGTGEIDEVTTLEPFRRRGLGTAVVSAAVAASVAGGNDLTFLVANERDWPREWYERLGFRVVGRRFEVWRKA